MLTTKMHISLILLPLIFLLTLSPQTSAGQQLKKEEQNQRTCRILFLSAPYGAPTQMHLFDGIESQEVDLPRRNLSPVYKIAPGPIKLQLLPEEFQTLELLPQGAPAVVVPEDVNNFYLLVVSDRTNKVAPVKMKLVKADNRHLGDGEMLWFNLTKDVIGGKLGSLKVSFKPGEVKRVRAPMKERGAYPVDLYYKRQGSEHIHPIFQTKWRHRPPSRSLVFILREPNRKTPVVYNFRDLRLDKKKPIE